MDASHKQYGKPKKPDTDKYIPQDTLYIQSSKAAELIYDVTA